MNIRRLKQVCKYGWQDAKTISQEPEVVKGRLAIFCDILHCFLGYNVWSNQYKKEKLYLLSGEQRETICLRYQEKNTKRDKWVEGFFNNYKFLNKWSSFKYERSANLQAKRCAAYKRQYGLGEKFFVGYDVKLHRHHFSNSIISSGKNCQLSEHVDIDYTGGLIIGDYVIISEGVKILTHNHVLDYSGVGDDKGCESTPLVIKDCVWIGARSFILPGVKEIGRGALISSCSCVRCKIPPYAIVMGNPARIVGFRFLPKRIAEMEKRQYPESERIPLEILEMNYKRFYKDRVNEIKEFVKL